MTRRYVAAAVETTFGTANSLYGSQGIKVQSSRDPINRSPVYDETIDEQAAAAAYAGATVLSGTLEGAFRINQMSPLLESTFGAASVGVYSLENTPKSVTMEICDDSSGAEKAYQYAGCIMNRVQFIMRSRELIMTKWDWIARSVNLVSALTAGSPTYPTDVVSMFYNASLVFDSEDPNINVKDLNLTIDRKVDPNYLTLGSDKLRGISVNGVVENNGSITLDQHEWTKYQLATFGSAAGTEIGDKTFFDANGYEKDVDLGSAELTIDINGTDGTDIATINLPVIVFSDVNREMRGRNAVDRTLNFRGIGDASFTLTDESI